MRIDERGRQHEAVGVDDAMRVRVEAGAECGDDAVVDPDVELLVDPFGRVEHACVADDDVVAWCVLAVEHQATSTGSPTGTGAGAPTSRS